MIDFEKYTNPYDRKARVYPALLCLLPIVISISIKIPELYTSLSGLVALVVAFGGLQLLSHVARDGGKKLEKGLFNNWGGIPSVTIFRYTDNIIPAPAKAILHRTLALKTEIGIPTKDIEENSPNEADEVYRSWSDYLRRHSRDTNKFSLLFNENINYGFRRNILGMKSLYGFSGIVALLIFTLSNPSTSVISNIDFTIMIFISIYSLCFMFFVNEEWVKVPAEEYAKRLVEVVEHL